MSSFVLYTWALEQSLVYFPSVLLICLPWLNRILFPSYHILVCILASYRLKVVKNRAECSIIPDQALKSVPEIKVKDFKY